MNDVIMILHVMDNFADFFPIQQKLHLKQVIVPLIAAFVVFYVYKVNICPKEILSYTQICLVLFYKQYVL